MEIRNNTGTNFKAVRLSPAPDNWNQRVLNSVLRSDFIRDIIKKDVKNNRDTYISFAEHYDPAAPDYTRYNHMYVNIKGHDKDITLGSHSTYRYESGQFFRRAKIIKTGPDDLGKDLSEQIDNLKDPNIKDDTPLVKRTLEGLKKLAGGIVLEKPRDYKEFRGN